MALEGGRRGLGGWKRAICAHIRVRVCHHSRTSVMAVNISVLFYFFLSSALPLTKKKNIYYFLRSFYFITYIFITVEGGGGGRKKTTEITRDPGAWQTLVQSHCSVTSPTESIFVCLRFGLKSFFFFFFFFQRWKTSNFMWWIAELNEHWSMG